MAKKKELTAEEVAGWLESRSWKITCYVERGWPYYKNGSVTSWCLGEMMRDGLAYNAAASALRNSIVRNRTHGRTPRRRPPDVFASFPRAAKKGVE